MCHHGLALGSSSWAGLWWQPLFASGYLICTSSLDKFINHGHLALDIPKCVKAMNAVYLLLGISCYCYSLLQTNGFLIFRLMYFFQCPVEIPKYKAVRILFSKDLMIDVPPECLVICDKTSAAIRQGNFHSLPTLGAQLLP
jgi:hypothetical protein